MKIVIGLGNPGKEYSETRHNIGFRIVDWMNKNYGGDFKLDKKSNSEVSEVKINGTKVLLVKPQTFMNNSGQAVNRLVKNLKFKIENLVVIHDDLDIPFGKTKLSFDRSSAGHKGVESVIRLLKSHKFYRLRFGTFSNQLAKIRKEKNAKKRVSGINNFVIGSFSPNERSKLNKIIKSSASKILSII